MRVALRIDWLPMATVRVDEVFESIQGESSWAGLPCFFIRLAGCNLRCTYCDTKDAYGPGREMTVAELTALCLASRAPIAEITGGEPLLQPGFGELAAALRDRTAKTILVETNGSRDISVVPADVVAVMDVKCPGSGASGAMDLANVGRLRPYDEVKFVLGDRRDYEWATAFVKRYRLTSACHAVFFSPVFGGLDAGKLGEWILQDGLAVRLQVQLHRILGLR